MTRGQHLTGISGLLVVLEAADQMGHLRGDLRRISAAIRLDPALDLGFGAIPAKVARYRYSEVFETVSHFGVASAKCDEERVQLET